MTNCILQHLVKFHRKDLIPLNPSRGMDGSVFAPENQQHLAIQPPVPTSPDERKASRSSLVSGKSRKRKSPAKIPLEIRKKKYEKLTEEPEVQYLVSTLFCLRDFLNRINKHYIKSNLIYGKNGLHTKDYFLII